MKCGNVSYIEPLEPLLHFQKKEKSDQGLSQCIFLDAMFYCIATLLKPKDDYGKFSRLQNFKYSTTCLIRPAIRLRKKSGLDRGPNREIDLPT